MSDAHGFLEQLRIECRELGQDQKVRHINDMVIQCLNYTALYYLHRYEPRNWLAVLMPSLNVYLALAPYAKNPLVYSRITMCVG